MCGENLYRASRVHAAGLDASGRLLDESYAAGRPACQVRHLLLLLPMRSSFAECPLLPHFCPAVGQDSRGVVRLDLPELCCVCPVGTNCSTGGVPLEALPLLPGYYRLSDDASDVRRCPDAAANCTYANQCLETTSGCAGGSDIATVCRSSLRGIFCTQCEPDTNHTKYYTCN